jgi:DNA modification methylase
MTATVLVGDCLDLMQTFEPESFDGVVTDPPYGLKFMGNAWDHGVPGGQFWVQTLRVIKPGAYLLAFGGTRTFHRLACAIEDAGFEIHDTISWLYGSGFPKHRSKLKPGWEPIILARRPAPRATLLNIEACRLPVVDVDYARNHSGDRGHDGTRGPEDIGSTNIRAGGGSASDAGRWPANVVFDEQAAEMLDAQSGTLTSGANPTRRGSNKFANTYGEFVGQEQCEPARGVDVGGASRFYYCAKASRADRNAGLDGHAEKPLNWSSGTASPGTFQRAGTHRAAQNHHPTVKPLELMQWLCRLVTPKGGTVLDPFCGSGSTGRAAVAEGFSFVGIELDPEYAAIARARIADYAPLFEEGIA